MSCFFFLVLIFSFTLLKSLDNDKSVCDEYGDNVTAGGTSGVMDVISKKCNKPPMSGKPFYISVNIFLKGS